MEIEQREIGIERLGPPVSCECVCMTHIDFFENAKRVRDGQHGEVRPKKRIRMQYHVIGGDGSVNPGCGRALIRSMTIK